MRFNRFTVASLLAIPLSLITTSVQATPVSGIANIAGNVTVTASSIEFDPQFVVPVAGATETGDFTGLTGGTIMSLFDGPQIGPTNVANFIRFTNGVAQPITFDLTFIAPGVGTPAGCNSSTSGAECTPPGSPFTLFQLTSSTVIASLQLNGNSYIGSSATGSSPTTSIFSTQTALNGTIPQIIAQLNSGGAVTGATYSASFATAPVPEPTSLLLMGLGLVGAGIVARRKVVRN
jgi:hypothetical protein